MTAASSSAVLNEIVETQTGDGSPGLTLGVETITVAAGDTVSISVVVNMSSGMGKATAMSLSCSGLPEEAACSFVPGTSGAAAGSGASTLRIATSAPRDCGSSTPYGVPEKSAVLPVAGLLLALAGRRRAVKGLLVLAGAVAMMSGMTGCGTGNCTDLGTRPGTYTITVVGSAGGAQVSRKVKLVVTP
jgi:MYXO-CTERM domain-containing protein